MAGADGSQLLDVTRWAASFMARLFTGATTPAHLLAEEDVLSGGGNSLYRSVSTEEDDVELDGGDARRSGSELAADADDSDREQLLAADEGEDPCRARSVCERGLNHGVHTTSMSKQAHDQLRRRHPTGAAPCSGGDAAVGAAESEPLALRRRGAERASDVVETVEHPFGCGRRERESSSLLLLSS